MANTHEVTVFVWRNGPVNHGQVSGTTGHAAIKLQDVGSGKGDYHYLSFWPDKPDASPRYHSMTGRHGPGSLEAAAQQDTDSKRFATSDMTMHDIAKAKGKPDIKFRFRGFAVDKMRAYIEKIVNAPKRFNTKIYNCSNVVAECLIEGGAPSHDQRYKPFWLPEDIERWCRQLHESGRYSSEMIGTPAEN